MKKLMTLMLMLCVVMTAPAMAVVGETLELNEDLMGFRNELTGEVVRLGMTAEEVEQIAGPGYKMMDFPAYSLWVAYEGGLMISYNALTREVGAITVAPHIINDRIYVRTGNNKDAGETERLYEPGTHSIAVRKDTGEEISTEMLREEVEAITGAPIRETYIDYEYAYADRYHDTISYAATDKVLVWENDRLTTIDVPGITKVDYEGISVGYRGVQQDGKTLYIVDEDCFTDSGCWYRLANGIAAGDSGETIKGLLGESAVMTEKENGARLDAYVYFADDGAKLISCDEAKVVLNAASGNYKKLLTLSFSLSEEGEVSRIEIWNGCKEYVED